MKKYIKFIPIYVFLLTPAKLAITPAIEPDKAAVVQQQIYKVITNLQPALTDQKAAKLADAISRYSEEFGIDWKLSVAIMFKESSLRMDPQNCKVNFTKCNDMGIGQVRYSVWGKVLNIDKKRMVTDVDYAVRKTFKVLHDYKSRYGKKELNWFTRYHSATPELRYAYMQRLNHAYAKINAIKD